MPELLIIALYFLVMVIVGVVSRRRASQPDDFFVAGRKGSNLFITGSLLATIIGGSATVGLAGLGFIQGLTSMWWLLVGSIGLVILGLFLAGKVRRFGVYTLPELVGKQYGHKVALAASILIVVAWVGITAGQIVAAGAILSVLGIGNPVLWMVIFTGVFVIYTVLGGQYAVIRTDTVQIVIVFSGILSGLVVLLSRLGGWEGLYDMLPLDHFAFPLSNQFGGGELVKYLLLVGLPYVVGPDMYSRLFCARDVKTARSSVLWTALLIVPITLAITLMGMAAAALFPQISAEQAFATIISQVLSPVLGGVVLAALLGAIMSSADTVLFTAGTILTVDIIGWFKPSLGARQLLSLSRWGIVLLALAALALALVLKGVITALMFAYSVYTAGLILPVIAGFYRDKLKITPRGAFAAVIGGGSLAIVSQITKIPYLDLWSLLLSGVLLLAVSFIDNRWGGVW